MTSKTTKKAISDALSDLTKEKLEEFCSALRDRREEPRIRKSAIQGKTIIAITDVLIETFTEDVAVEVTLTLLKQINCNKVAQDLGMVNPGVQVKSDIKSLQDKREKYKEFEQKYKDLFQHNKKQVVVTEKKIRADMEMLHLFLREEEEARLADLRDEEKLKADVVRREMKNIQEQISSLSDNISAAEQELQEPSGSFVRVECPVPEPQLVSGVMIDVSKHQGNLTYRVWEKIKDKVKFTPVLLDPNTADSWLCLSEDLTSVKIHCNTSHYAGTNYKTKKRELPDNPERFTTAQGFGYVSGSVLGSEGFSSGKHSWEVELGDLSYWHIGVARETVDRKFRTGYSSIHGFWCVNYMFGKYKTGSEETIPVQRNLQKIRVQLDYDRGEVSFYDPEDMSQIYTHEDVFTDKLYPFILIGSADNDEKPTDVRICQVEISHSVLMK